MYTELSLTKDKQTVTKEGIAIAPRIEGVKIRRLNLIEDARVELLEIFRPSWGYHPDPLVYAYHVLTHPGVVRGWVVHQKQDDRIFNCTGTLRVVLFDYREESPTYEMLNEFVFSEKSRSLIVFPKGVFHAVQNIRTTDAIFINMPTRPYDHEDPDKFRLPLKNDIIPFDFEMASPCLS